MTISAVVLVAAPWLALASGADIVERVPTLNVSSSQVRCSIHAEKGDSGTRLDAVISAGGPVSGSYAFKVVPHGGGAPLIDEQGKFDIKTVEPSEVKQASLDLPRSQGYKASLSVVWPNGSSSCSASTS